MHNDSCVHLELCVALGSNAGIGLVVLICLHTLEVASFTHRSCFSFVLHFVWLPWPFECCLVCTTQSDVRRNKKLVAVASSTIECKFCGCRLAASNNSLG